MWHDELLPGLKGMARAMFSPLRVLGEREGALVFAVSKESVREKCAKHLPELQALIAEQLGVQMRVTLLVTGEPDHELDNSGAMPRPPEARRSAAPPPPVEVIEDEDIDISSLEDVPPEAVQTPEAMLQDFFPGSSMIEEQR